MFKATTPKMVMKRGRRTRRVSSSASSQRREHRISGANLQIVSGSGSTDGTVNGLGDVIIGYDEAPSVFGQTGSQNPVLGDRQTFTSYAGLIAGVNNTVSAPFADVFGVFNTAGGVISSVTAGADNSAVSGNSSVSGGQRITASGNYSSVSGGAGNTASGDQSSVSGGVGNTASGLRSSILGGNSVTVNTEDGTYPSDP